MSSQLDEPQKRGKINLLALILDLNPVGWLLPRAEGKIHFEDALQILLVFINSHLSLHCGTRLVLIGGMRGSSQIIYKTEDVALVTENPGPSNYRKLFNDCNNKVVKYLKDILKGIPIPEDINHANNLTKDSGMVCSLSLALTYCNKIIESNRNHDVYPRILIISVTPETQVKFVSLMNCIFTAQRMGIPIDLCKVGNNWPPTLLRHGSYITGGIYREVSDKSEMLQCLLSLFLIETKLRPKFAIPEDENIDLRASCFCHKKIISHGYTCPLCLSVFCNKVEKCITCGTEFEN